MSFTKLTTARQTSAQIVLRQARMARDGDVPQEETKNLSNRLDSAVRFGRQPRPVRWGESAREAWAEVYGPLFQRHAGHIIAAVKKFLSDGAAKRLQLEQLPGYAPDLNPDEGVWKHLKCVELKNLCCQNLAELRVELRNAKERLRHKREVILGCIRQPGFEV